MRSALAIALGALLIASGGDAQACASCGCGDPTLTASGIEKPYLNRVRLVLDEHYGDFRLGDSLTGESTWFLRSSLGLSWTPHVRITLTALLPWITSFIRTQARGTQTINGLGDGELSARALLFQERRFAPHHLLWATGGIKLPTGYRVKDNQGFPYSDDDQPGSGSWDPFGAATYAWYSGNVFSSFVSASYRQTTPGWHGYRRGSTLGASAALQAQPWSRVALALGVDVLWQQADRLPNHVVAPNTGGVVTYIAPAILVSPGTDWLLRLVVDAPAVTSLYGQQAVGTQVALSVAYDVK